LFVQSAVEPIASAVTSIQSAATAGSVVVGTVELIVASVVSVVGAVVGGAVVGGAVVDGTGSSVVGDMVASVPVVVLGISAESSDSLPDPHAAVSKAPATTKHTDNLLHRTDRTMPPDVRVGHDDPPTRRIVPSLRESMPRSFEVSAPVVHEVVRHPAGGSAMTTGMSRSDLVW
jgi:hypothetical protein